MSQLPISPIVLSYFQGRMATLGATPSNIRVTLVNPEAEPPASKIMDVDIFSEDTEGNIEIKYYSIDGELITYYTNTKNPAPRFYVVKRLKNPAGDNKYLIPSGQGTFPFFPPPLLEKYKQGIKIETLVLTEGVFKAFKAQVCGLDCVGLSSISHYAAEGKLYADLTKLIQRCQVAKIIILWDADCRNISEKSLSVREDLTKRPSGFYAAAKRIRELVLEAHPEMKVTFSHIINNHLSGKGLDDLLAEAENTKVPTALIIQDLLSSNGTYFYSQDVTKDIRPIFTYFCLRDPQKFYDLHGHIIKDKVFNFHQKMYEADDNGQVTILESSTEGDDEKEVFFEFYTVKVNQATGKKEIQIDHYQHVELLRKLNFRRYDTDAGFITVKIIDNVVQQVSKEEVRDVFLNYIKNFQGELPHDIDKKYLLSKLYKGLGTYFSIDMMGRMTTETPIEFSEHTKESAFFYYLNGYVEVTSKGAQLKPYSTLSKCIWANQIIQRNFDQVASEDYQNFSWFRFMQNIANQFEVHPHYGRKNERKDPRRFEALKTIIGYLLHAYFETELKAVILTDSKIDESGDANGRSGKTLLIKGLGYIINKDHRLSKTYAELNGKDFDAKGNFKYQELGLDTKLVHLNDVKRNFNIEELFNDITEGIRRERKNESPSIIRAKIAISSNRTIKVKGGSAKARCLEFELAEFYDPDWTPEREFGERFFSDWGKEEWQKFDNCMLDCVSTYLQKGVIQPDALNLNERKKLEETSPEFVRWMEDKDEVFVNAHEVNKTEIFEEFKTRYPDWSKITQRRFIAWLKTYCQHDSTYHPIKKEDERRSNGKDFITFWRIERQKNDDLPF
mgnify:CR=1 FL=1